MSLLRLIDIGVAGVVGGGTSGLATPEVAASRPVVPVSVSVPLATGLAVSTTANLVV